MAMYDPKLDGDIEHLAIIDMLEDLKNQVNANTESIKYHREVLETQLKLNKEIMAVVKVIERSKS